MEMVEHINKRIEWIDTAKGIGLLFVIGGHLHVPYLATWAYLFHMPLFFFLSGMVFSGTKYSFTEYTVKRVKSLIVPYFSFAFVIWLFYAIVNCFVAPEQRLYGSNLEMLEGLLVQKHFWTIWFLTALFLVEIMYYLIDRATKHNMIVTTIVSSILCVFGLLRYRFGFGSLPWNLDVALVAQFFFHAGRVFRRSKWMSVVSSGEKRRNLLMMSFFLALNLVSGALGIKIAHESLDMSVGLYGNEVLTFISAFSGIMFIIAVSNMVSNKYVQYLGRNTMVIFSLHSRIIIVLCTYIYGAVGLFQGNGLIEQILCAGVTFVVIMLVLIPATELVKRSRIHQLFGL